MHFRIPWSAYSVKVEMRGHLPPYIRCLLIALQTGAELTRVHVFMTPGVAGSWPPKQRSLVA